MKSMDLETVISDHRKMVMTFLILYLQKLNSKILLSLLQKVEFTIDSNDTRLLTTYLIFYLNNLKLALINSVHSNKNNLDLITAPS